MKIIQFSFFFATILLLTSCAKPIAQFTIDTKKREAPVKLKFQNESENAEQYIWVFGDGDTSFAEAPFHTFKNSGDYDVTLIAKKGKKASVFTQKVTIAEPEKCLVELETEFGTMTILLYDATPKHRDNFIKLAEEGYFDGLLFHRVMNGFMVQGGDPDSRKAKKGQQLGMGGSGYTVESEFVDTLIHIKGALAAARQPDYINPKKASSGSQFYIVQGRTVSDEFLNQVETQGGFKYTSEQRKQYKELNGTPQLDRQYTVFGQVIKGLDVIDKIAAVQTNQSNRPIEDVKMKVRIVK